MDPYLFHVVHSLSVMQSIHCVSCLSVHHHSSVGGTLLVPSYYLFMIHCLSGFCGLGVASWPLVPKFAGSNPAEAIGFLRAKKFSARLPSERK